MRASHLPAALLIAGGLSALAAPAAGAAPGGNCVSNFTSTLGQAGVAGAVISGGARAPLLHPFGRNAVPRPMRRSAPARSGPRTSCLSASTRA